MIRPQKFTVSDFFSQPQVVAPMQYRTILEDENLTGSELVDNLILLRFCELEDIQRALKEKYGMPFAWVKVDPTPEEFRDVADKHHVLIQRGRELIVYVPLGAEVDDSMLQVDIPNYRISFRFIADCNLKLIKTGLSPSTLSYKLANFRPLLVFKRLVLDCKSLTGTDLHFESHYNANKQPEHIIRYRVNKAFVNSRFTWDYDMAKRVIQTMVAKLTPSSGMDVDTLSGVETNVRDLFHDGSCDLRVSGMRVDAGYYVDIAIQDIGTTTKTVNELGFPDADVRQIRQIATRRTGLTLVTGEMRSGKNTTIFAMLNEIDLSETQVMEYSNPIENHMEFPQYNYRGDLDLLHNLMRMAKKQDLDLAVLNEIPNAAVAFAVRDLVNSAISVWTTTHINRIWHLPNKLREFFGNDYKTIISQLNAVINHKMFRRWSCPNFQKRMLIKEQGQFELFCYNAGVRQYFVPTDQSTVTYSLQPLVEILEIDDSMKTAMLNFDEIWRAEQMLQLQIQQEHATLENKCAAYVNAGLMPLSEMNKLY